MVKPLNSLELYENIKKDFFARKIFKSVVPRDRLPKRVEYPSAFIINTDNHNQPGEHLLAVFYNEDGFCTFFDSFGREPKEFLLDSFLKKTSTGWDCNKVQIQDMFSSTCGYYCIYFILLMSRGLTLKDILILYEKKNFIVNDLKISKLLL